VTVTPTNSRSKGVVIRLQTLGTLDLIDDDGHPHPLLAQPKRLGLLVYLAAERRSKRRDTIMPLFWPELDQARARGALRQAVYVLRRELGDVIRLRGEDELGIDPAALWLDVEAFETAAGRGDWRAAAALYRGDFLDGFFIPGAAPDFDSWTGAERARLRALASRVMWSAAEGSDASADADQAVGWIRRAVALARDDELTLRRALRELDRLGDRASALQLYQEFHDRLHDEYGAEPSTET
jgi:DNA-binding SARP family transcriptional activator